MLWYHYVFGAVLIVFSIVITIVVLMQEGRSQNLSGAIAGGADTFLGKSKGRTIEAKLERITKWMIVCHDRNCFDSCIFCYSTCCIPCFSFYRIRIKMINLA